MARARLVITAVVLEGRSQAEVARAYGLWVNRLVAPDRDAGEAAFEPRTRRPHRSPTVTAPRVGTGRTPTRTPVIMLIADLDIRIVTGELLRELILDPTRDYQPQQRNKPDP